LGSEQEASEDEERKKKSDTLSFPNEQILDLQTCSTDIQPSSTIPKTKVEMMPYYLVP